MKNILEVCCGSFEDVYFAQLGGADRVELNCALSLGGLTPSLASLIKCKKELNIPVICMVRPRGAGFCYRDKDLEVIFEDAKLFLEYGADGLAFGFLNEDFTIDIENTKKMITLIHSYNKEAVFHRAFDVALDIDASIKTLIDLKVDRILTSGKEKNVCIGQDNLAYLQKHYGDQIEILAGSGVKEENISELATNTGIKQFHSSAKTWFIDKTTDNKHVSYAYHHSDDYEVVDSEKVKSLKMILNNL